MGTKVGTADRPGSEFRYFRFTWVYSAAGCIGSEGLSKLFEELKRRNVIRVAVAYVIAGWLVLQIAEFVLEIIVAPEWIIKVFLLAIGLGLLPVLIFSWAYEIT